ncbi:MAG TPA: homoaconitase [Candidatus Marinimicrobia bacterium]|jgi:homoaconitate hydratase|nr:homoaconitase [Candidatus Neomarinimicrobiota bacterium]MDP6143301.1 homoaconitase [Candidatus Neomarinimicrobiota bacterium]MDP6260619.1 homoaconitase [Candidatus Neomarinimicrobiota bacterium]MDP7127407.1 homoaconitase [Candidatus Neomarinimicrobiota bacterium]MDP7337353.1 homoaconitase [Candidatus Neomarinimicrobiota bacterium]|tara:strand:+ start:369 stop:2333 length:1965 start_codon:yes stop_codon:yes gene_type:complete
MPQTLIEKIVQKHAVGLEPGHIIQSGDFISIQPAHVMTHDNTGAVMGKFKAIGATKMDNPSQPVFALDHNVQDTSEANLKKYAGIELFAKDMGVDFYPAGRGIGHQIMCEEGYAFSGGMMVASDSHSNMYGGLGCLGTPVVRTDAAALWATGQTWWQVPPIAKVELSGVLKRGVSGKDVILAICGYFNNDEALNHALEFSGDGIAQLSIDQRLTISNMTTEWGALAGIFPIDDITINWLKNRAGFVSERGLSGVPSDENSDVHPRINLNRIDELVADTPKADADVYYARSFTIDLGSIQPFIAGPDNLKTTMTISEASEKKMKIDKAYLVSCVNSRVEDLSQAADAVNGNQVANGVEFYVAAASSEVQAESEKRGDWQKLKDAGAITLPPGCGMCIGLGMGLLEENEVGISATNRNFKGRMGDKTAKAYLASPAVVATSAITGQISSPSTYDNTQPVGEMHIHPKPSTETSTVKILDGFPEELTGELIFCYQDNLNTDGIYPGKYTYIDDFTPEQQAEVVMENYDPQFGKLVKEGDFLVGGYNFGSGSSREQAATALKYRGIKLVLAGSFSETYKRNAINNGFLVLEAPELVNDLKDTFGTEKLTQNIGIDAVIDFSASVIGINDTEYPLPPVGTAAQEMIVTGGLENWVKERI